MHMNNLQMAANLELPVVSFSADGASSELAAQSAMDKEKSELPPISYEYPLYGVYLKAPVFRHTGPVVSITDPPHARKTGRNQPQHGTHTASLGTGYLVNRSLVGMYECGGTGLVHRDVENVDKQDDGAARRVFHANALRAITDETLPMKREIKEGFNGLFVYLFVLGNLYDAWLSRTMCVRDRILSALRARFFLDMWHKHIVKLSSTFPDLYSATRSFISPASFHIFNRLCDSLVLLAIIYSRTYPDQPFCPWLMGTDFVEHLFGLARMILPNFTYGEFLKMIKHIELRQRLLLSGKFKENRERHSASGYIMDYDATPLTSDDKKLATLSIPDADLNELVSLAFQEAFHICRDLLHIPVLLPTETTPLQLTPLGAHRKKVKPARKKAVDGDGSGSGSEHDPDSDSDTDSEVGDTREDLSLDAATATAAHDTARYSALCEDTDSLLEREAIRNPSNPVVVGAIGLSITTDKSASLVLAKSELVDGTGKLSISKMLKYRERLQSGTTVHSERSISLNPKFVAAEKEREDAAEAGQSVPKIPMKEASHRLRIAQQLDGSLQRKQPRKDRELRWKNIAQAIRTVVKSKELPNLSGKNVTEIFQMKIGNYAIFRTLKRTYVGEILDMYKKGASGRYGSIDKIGNASSLQAISVRVYLPLKISAVCPYFLIIITEHVHCYFQDGDANQDDEPLIFSSTHNSHHLHTYAPIDTLLYHLGPRVMSTLGTRGQLKTRMVLDSDSEAHWMSLTQPKVVEKLTIRIRGSKLFKK
ncbi:hypothetical protein FPV67DRAFT_784077 [Lyophyllum atratum]|nr:hypothetical protein FPV67DRAFT_784077 [Lyophyllum atratum]